MNKTIRHLIIYVLLVGILLTGCNTIADDVLVDVDDVKTEALTNINKIKVNVSSSDINIMAEDRDNIEIQLIGKKSSNIEHELRVDKISSDLEIEIEFLNKINLGRTDFTLNINVPNEYEGELVIDCSSGNVNINDINPKELNIDLSSGDISLSNMILNDLNIEVSSGDSSFSDIRATTVEYNSSSGQFTANGLVTDYLEYDITSGDIELNNFTGDIKGTSSSAHVTVNYEKFSNDIDIESTSGDVLISLPDDAEFELSAEVSSGKIRCDFPITVVGVHKDDQLNGTVISDKNKINIDTSSGDITIN